MGLNEKIKILFGCHIYSYSCFLADLFIALFSTTSKDGIIGGVVFFILAAVFSLPMLFYFEKKHMQSGTGQLTPQSNESKTSYPDYEIPPDKLSDSVKSDYRSDRGIYAEILLQKGQKLLHGIKFPIMLKSETELYFSKNLLTNMIIRLFALCLCLSV